MILANTLKKISYETRWEIIKHFRTASGGDAISRILILQVARLAAILLVACVWVAFILSTGLFTVAFVILLGAVIGSTQFFLPKGLNRVHLPSALILTLLGGVFCNVFAGFL
jgi:uncharacterized membrane protein SpoIIM required for sporulation